MLTWSWSRLQAFRFALKINGHFALKVNGSDRGLSPRTTSPTPNAHLPPTLAARPGSRGRP
jgi:hypothetical protein